MWIAENPRSSYQPLDEYRRSFGEAYETVVRVIRERLRLEPTGRPAKSTASLIEKLRRESIRLVQVQDIAGCRVIVDDVVEQERVVASLGEAFSAASIVDRRANPSYGYRAVHVVVNISGKLIEVQVRSSLQHLWAELSEKLSDLLDPAIKYGGGDEQTRKLLGTVSEMIAIGEGVEATMSRLVERPTHEDQRHLVDGFRRQMEENRDRLGEGLKEAIAHVTSLMRKER